MAPELLDPEKFGLKKSKPTFRTDIYALGMVMLEVRTVTYDDVRPLTTFSGLFREAPFL